MKKKRWYRLQIKIIGWSFIPTAIILSSVAWLTYYSYQNLIGDMAVTQDQELVKSKAAEANAAIGEVLSPALLPILTEIDTDPSRAFETRVQAILRYVQGLTIFDGGVYFLDEQGRVAVAREAGSRALGQDWSGSAAFKYIEGHPGMGAVTNIEPIGPQGEDAVCMALPMQNAQGGLAGAGCYCLLIQPAPNSLFHTTMTRLDLGPQYYLLDGNRRVLFSPDRSQIGLDLSHEAYILQVLDDPKRAARVKKGSDELVASYANIMTGEYPEMDAPRWILVREVTWSEVMQPSLAYRRNLIILLALGLIVPVVVTLIGVNRITGPIQKLIHATEQVTAGQFKHRIEVKTGDEIEALAEQFNVMSARLQESYASLEKKVADRTRELQTLNSIISTASHSLDIQQILEHALNKTIEQMGFGAGAALRLEADPVSATLITQQGFSAGIARDLVSSSAIRSHESTPVHPPRVKTYEIGALQSEELSTHLAESGLHLLACVPLSTKGHTLGLLVLAKRDRMPLSPEELSLLNSVGQQVGVAMENAHLYEQAEQTAIVAERNRLARELHDAVTQTLFSASLIADVIPQTLKRDPERALQNAEELRELTRGALAEMRTMLLEMRPESLRRADIKALLTQLADAFVGRVRTPLQLNINGDCEVAHDVKIVFYRVTQEALNNIAKHSGARHVAVHLDCQPGHLHLSIQDDGLGFDSGSIPPGHMGIGIMHERASSIGARLTIESPLGQGTTVALDWGPAQKDGTDERSSDNPRHVSR